MHAHELHSRRVAADRVQSDPRRQLDGPAVEPDPPGEVQPHEAHHILDLERAGEVRMAHVVPGRVVQLDFLQMELRRRETVEGADMVVMHMGQDHIGDGAAVEPDEARATWPGSADAAARAPPRPRR